MGDQTSLTPHLRIAVTGAGGFVGRHVVEILAARGHTVLAATGERRPPADLQVHTTRVDLLNGDEVRRWVFDARPDRLIHLAWYTVPGQYWTSPDNERWLEASRALFASALEAGCERLVGVGSCAEYVWDGTPSSEFSTPIQPATPYGRAKDAARRALEHLADSAGASWAWARLFFLFGPYEPASRLVPSVIRAVLRGETAACTAGSQRRDFLYVREAASALAALLESSLAGPVNVASGEGIEIRTLVERLVSRLGGGSVAFGAVPDRPGEPASIVADVTRLSNELGWRQTIGWDEAFDECIAFERMRLA